MSVYIGYDLGDGDTSITKYSRDIYGAMTASAVTFSTLQRGEALPSVESVDSKTGTIRIGVEAILGSQNVEEVLVNFKRRPTTLNDAEFSAFRKAVLNFTNQLFRDREIRSVFQNAEEHEYIVAVGFPTTWNDDDEKLYREIFENTEMVTNPQSYFSRDDEIKVVVELYRESYAAMMSFVNRKGSFSLEELEEEDSAVVFDFGSSTADVTVLRKKDGGVSVDEGIRLGNDSLGARYIDRSIAELIIRQLDGDSKSRYELLLKANPGNYQKVVYHSRLLKQQYFEIENVSIRGSHEYFSPRTRDTLGFRLDDYFTAKLMEEALSAPIPELEGLTWEKACEQLFLTVSSALKEINCEPKIVMLTGGASRMDFVKHIALDVFKSPCRLVVDSDPSNCISHGLSLTPHKKGLEHAFLRAVDQFCDERIKTVIKDEKHCLAEDISSKLTDKVLGIAKEDVLGWRSGRYQTLHSMETGIENDVKNYLNSQGCKSVVETCVVDFVKAKIATRVGKEFNVLCAKHGISLSGNQSVGDGSSSKNVMIEIEGAPGVGDGISKVVDEIIHSGVVNIVIASVCTLLLPFVAALVAILGIPIVSELAAIIFGILALIPGPGWALIAVMVGVSVIYLATHGIEGARSLFLSKAKGWDFPAFVRERVSSDKIDGVIRNQRSNVATKIREEIANSSDLNMELSDSLGKAFSNSVKSSARDLAFKIRE